MRSLSPEQLDAADVGRSGIVSAGAGSGKTTVLVARYLRLLRAGIEPRRIVVMTFMRKAAAELRERIDSLVAEALREGVFEDKPLTEEERRRLFEARSRLTDGHIGTIHSFCRRVLVEEPVLMPKRPDFTELDSAEARRLRERAENAAAWASEPQMSPLARLLEAGMPRRDLRRITKNLLSKRWELVRVRAVVERGFKAMRGVIGITLETVLDDFGQRVEELWGFIGGLLQDPAAVGYLRGKAGWEKLGELEPDPDALATLLRIRDSLAPLFDGAFKASEETLAGLLWLRDFKTGASKCKALRNRNPFIEIRDLARDALPETSSLLERERRGFELTRMLLRWLDQVERGYDELKVKGNATDYDDLLNKVLEGLRDDSSLVVKLRGRYHHFLVDEFQDTDPRQWEIIRALALPRDDEARRGSRTIFIVGDRKQAIFGFRGGDNTVFLQAEKELRTVQGSFSRLLKDNYRSRRRVLDFVNPFFTALFSADGELLKSSRPVSTAVEPQWMDPKRSDGEGGLVTLVNTCALTSRVKSGKETLEALVTAGMIRNILQDGVDDFPQLAPYLESSGWTGPVVGVMARKGKQLMLLAAALDAQGLAGSYSVARGSGVFSSEEAQWLRSILSAIADPRDEVSLAAAMLSPLVGLSYEDLMEAKLGGVWFDAALDGDWQGEGGRWSSVRERWSRWRRLAALGSVSRLVAAILADSGIEAALGVTGHADRWRRLVHLLELIRAEERAGGISGPGDAAEWMRENRESDDFSEPVPEGAPVVLMTMHGAKGLEFPIVVLPFLKGRTAGGRSDMSLARLPGGERMLALKIRDETPPYEQKDTFLGYLLRRTAEEEGVLEEKRLFYVACTRARDHLILVTPFEPDEEGSLTGRRAGARPGGWLDRLLCVENGRLHLNGEEVGHCISVERFTDRGKAEKLPIERPIPCLDLLGPVSVYDPPVIAPSAMGELADCPVKFYLKRILRVDMEALGGETAGDFETDVEGNLRGSEFGAALHYLVSVAGVGVPSVERIGNLLKGASERWGLSTEDHDRLREHLVRLDGIEVWREAQRGRTRFEVPLRVELGGCLILGRIDALTETAEGYRIFDFKTDNLSGKRPVEVTEDSGYDLQVGVYALGVEKRFGRSVTGVHLLYTAEGGGSRAVNLEEIRPRVEKLFRTAAELARTPFAEVVLALVKSDCEGCGLTGLCKDLRG